MHDWKTLYIELLAHYIYLYTSILKHLDPDKSEFFLQIAYKFEKQSFMFGVALHVPMRNIVSIIYKKIASIF